MLHIRGREIPCDVLREPDEDRGGDAAWLAVPAEHVDIRMGEPFHLQATVLPARTILIADFAILGMPEAADS